MTYDFLKQIWKKLSPQVKACFLAGVPIGLLTHIFMITNKITNWDDITLPPGSGGSEYFGRWFVEMGNEAFSYWGAPGMNAVMAVILVILCACFTVDLLDIKSITGAVLTGAVLVTTPALVGTMCFMYVAAVYALSWLMSVVAIWLTKRFRFGIVPAVGLFVLSMAVYQAYFPYAAALAVLSVLVTLMGGEKIKDVIILGVRYLISLAAGMVGYLLSVKLSGFELAEYRGFDSIGKAGPAQYVECMLRAYHRVLQFFVTAQPSYNRNLTKRLNILAMLFLAVFIVCVFFMKKLYREKLRALIYIVLCGIMPLAAGLIYVMATKTHLASSTMIPGYCMIYVMLIVFAEKTAESGVRTAGIAALAALAVLALITYEDYRIDNNAYYRSYIANERMSALYNRIAARLEMTEGYSYGDRVAILGDWYPEKIDFYEPSMEAEFYEDIDSLSMENGLFTTGVRRKYMRTHLGIDGSEFTEEERTALMATDTYENMPAWPAAGCIEKIDGVWVMKMHE